MKNWCQKLALLSIVLMMPCAVWGAVCTTASGTALAFGSYTGVQTTPTSIVTTKCPSPDFYTIGLTAGTGAGATLTTRKMTGPGGATLNYQIFQNSTHTTNWDTTNTVTISTTTGVSINTTAYGLVPAGQAPTPGAYTDTMTISVTCPCGIKTGTFTVTATVAASCTISATSLGFGTYTGILLNVNSAVDVTCTNTTPYNVGLNAGTATGATVTTRKMTGASTTLNYTLYSNSGLTINWGNTVGTNTLSGTGNGALQALTVYGQIPAGQYVKPGSYTDTITATITY